MRTATLPHPAPLTCQLRHGRLADAHEVVAGVYLLVHQRPRGRHKHHLALWRRIRGQAAMKAS